jgi:integrase
MLRRWEASGIITSAQAEEIRRHEISVRPKPRIPLIAEALGYLGAALVHELRHTFASLWVDAGAGVKEVSVRAGYSSVAFTLDHYGHLYEDRSDALADQLDVLLGESSPDRAAHVLHAE